MFILQTPIIDPFPYIQVADESIHRKARYATDMNISIKISFGAINKRWMNAFKTGVRGAFLFLLLSKKRNSNTQAIFVTIDFNYKLKHSIFVSLIEDRRKTKSIPSFFSNSTKKCGIFFSFSYSVWWVIYRWLKLKNVYFQVCRCRSPTYVLSPFN